MSNLFSTPAAFAAGSPSVRSGGRSGSHAPCMAWVLAMMMALVTMFVAKSARAYQFGIPAGCAGGAAVERACRAVLDGKLNLVVAQNACTTACLAAADQAACKAAVTRNCVAAAAAPAPTPAPAARTEVTCWDGTKAASEGDCPRKPRRPRTATDPDAAPQPAAVPEEPAPSPPVTPSPCPAYATLTPQTGGSFRCVCDEGFEPVGPACEPKCAFARGANGTCLSQEEAACGKPHAHRVIVVNKTTNQREYACTTAADKTVKCACTCDDGFEAWENQCVEACPSGEKRVANGHCAAAPRIFCGVSGQLVVWTWEKDEWRWACQPVVFPTELKAAEARISALDRKVGQLLWLISGLAAALVVVALIAIFRRRSDSTRPV